MPALRKKHKNGLNAAVMCALGLTFALGVPALRAEDGGEAPAAAVAAADNITVDATVERAVPAAPDDEPEMVLDEDTGEMLYVLPDGRRVPVAEYDNLRKMQDRRMTWGWVTLWALGDGINPCAFVTIVMLVSMMATARRTRRETVVIGMSFTLAVFLAYMAIGWIFHLVLTGLKPYLIVSDLVYIGAFLLCVVCGILSLWDAFIVWRKKDGSGMKLQLPKSFKRRIQKQLSAGVRSSRLAVGTFVAGVMVSGIEAACTGQVFFPFIATLKEEDVGRALLMLGWYCFVFVLPLIVVFGLALFGVTNQQLSGWMQRNMALTKLLLALVFITMGLLLWRDLKWPPGKRAGHDVAPAAAAKDG